MVKSVCVKRWKTIFLQRLNIMESPTLKQYKKIYSLYYYLCYQDTQYLECIVNFTCYPIVSNWNVHIDLFHASTLHFFLHYTSLIYLYLAIILSIFPVPNFIFLQYCPVNWYDKGPIYFTKRYLKSHVSDISTTQLITSTQNHLNSIPWQDFL